MQLSSVVLIGSGNVAYHFARMFYENNITLSQICGRNHKAVQEISNQFKIEYCTDIQQVQKADLYIICVSDDYIREISMQIPYKDALVTHTAGSISINEISAKRKGVLYPLQTFSKSRILKYNQIPFFIEASNQNDEKILKNICHKISNNVHTLSSEQRTKLHLAAIWVNNYTNFNNIIAQEILNEVNISLDVMKPLCNETFEKLQTENPIQTQTGPAKRNDISIFKKHKALINNDNYKNLYEQYFKTIVAYYHKTNKKNDKL